MKTAIVLSDTHGNVSAIEKLYDKMKEADYIFHLGDHYYDMEIFKEFEDKIISVKGNCDGGGEDKELEIEGIKILLTHGDKYHVKFSLSRLIIRAKEINANVVFYGHTHVKRENEEDGVKMVNPGNMTRFGNSSYCYACFDNGKCVTKIVDI